MAGFLGNQITFATDPTTEQKNAKAFRRFNSVVSGTANAIVLSHEVPILGYKDGVIVNFVANETNTSTSVSIDIDGLGAVPVSNAMIRGVRKGANVIAIYNGGAFQFLNQVTGTDLIQKSVSTEPAFKVVGTELQVNNGLLFSNYQFFDDGHVITLPALVSATDYNVCVDGNGSLAVIKTDNVTSETVLGGFHVYHTTGTINPSSIWDIRYRPSCNPRAMTLSPDKRVWVDIYLMDTEYGINGYSRGDQTIADGGSPPKIPAIYGGNGTTTYGSLTWFEAWDLAIAAGKRLPFYGEFTGFAFGVVERQAVGVDPTTTKYQAGNRSACGVEQVTGAMWQWGADVNGTATTDMVSWQNITDGRGDVYTRSTRAVLLGSGWGDGSFSGSRSSLWLNAPSNSGGGLGVRAVCDHLML